MSKDLVMETQTAQVADLVLLNTPDIRIAEALNITRYRVGKIKASPEFKAYLKEVKEKNSAVASALFMDKLESLAPLAFAALEHNLKELKLDAVRVFAEIAGLNKKEEAVQHDSTIQILMPGAQEPQVIDVKSEVVSE